MIIEFFSNKFQVIHSYICIVQLYDDSDYRYPSEGGPYIPRSNKERVSHLNWLTFGEEA
jgi:hypothetical protein